MSRAGTAARLLLVAGLAACASEDHNVPEQESEESAAAPGATLQDSLVTGEAIQTVPPLEGTGGAAPAGAGGATPQAAGGDTAARP
ncbi:MAG TPA: hypothetical protein VHG51_03375 [Longimicrobiaceae bacterium]|nr:hypothetical protein [Longimicrobiaceae bacterium]